MGRRDDEIGVVGRLALSVLGLFLLGGLWSNDLIGLALGVIGLALLVAATGLVELAVALWYRHSRHRVAK
jgi:hypothetical protein